MESDEGVARAIGCDAKGPRNGLGIGSPRRGAAVRKRVSISSPRGPVKRSARTRPGTARAAATPFDRERRNRVLSNLCPT